MALATTSSDVRVEAFAAQALLALPKDGTAIDVGTGQSADLRVVLSGIAFPRERLSVNERRACISALATCYPYNEQERAWKAFEESTG